MKKIIAAMLIAVLSLSCAALAATYTDPDRDFTFEYDDAAFEISMDDHTDDEDLVILDLKNADFGEGYIRIHFRDLEDGETFPTKADFAEIETSMNTEVTQGEWNGFKDVFMYDMTDEEGFESVFIVPVYDDDKTEVEDILTVNVRVSNLEDEEAGMGRDDAISAVLDTLKVIDD